MHVLPYSVPLTLQQATADPSLHRDSWTLTGKSGSVSCRITAHFSLVLVHTRFHFCPSSFCYPQSCISSGGSMVGLMVTSSKRSYATLMSAAPRVPAPVTGHCWPVPPQETLRHSKAGLAQSVLCRGSWYRKDFEPSKLFWWVWSLILNAILPLLPSCWGFSFSLGGGVSFIGGIQHSPVNDCCSVIVFNDQSMK